MQTLVLNLKSKKKNLLALLVVLIIARVVLTLLENKETNKQEQEHSALKNTIQLSRDNADPIKKLALVPVEQTEFCQKLHVKYQNLDEVKKNKSTSVRFKNIHKNVEGNIYRLRFFYKDSSENEIPSYLLYLEDKNEEEHLVEKTSYKKGPLYSKIENVDGTVIYTEEGVNIETHGELFLHYENGDIKDLQGTVEKNLVECRY